MSLPLKSAPSTVRKIVKDLNLLKNTNWDMNPQRFVAKEKNGMGHYILPCQKLVINYDHPSIGKGGSSTGVVAFLKNSLIKFAQENPSIEIIVQPTPYQHPIVKAHYGNGRSKQANLANLGANDVQKAIQGLRNASGEKERQWIKSVISERPTITGVFDAFSKI